MAGDLRKERLRLHRRVTAYPNHIAATSTTVRSRQHLRVAMVCSTRARIFAWDRFTAFWPGDRVSHRPQRGGGPAR
jgi:non-ribosomal peptide synthetase component F